MMLQALLPLIPGAIKLGSDIINKPKEEDFEANTQYLERYINNLKGANRGTGERVTRPLFKKVKQQNRATDRKIQSAVGKGDLSSSEEAQLQISAGQASTGALQEVGEKAADIQTQVDIDTGKQVSQVLSQIAGIKEQARLNFKKAQRDYRKQIGTDLLGLAGTAVVGGLSKMANTNKAYESAKASGLIGDISLDEYKNSAEGFTDLREYNRMLGLQDNIKSTIIDRVPGVNPEEIMNMSKSQATKFIKDAEKEQGKVFRKLAKGEITEELLNGEEARLLTETQKNNLWVKSFGDTKGLSEYTRQVLIDSKDPNVTLDQMDTAIVDGLKQGIPLTEMNALESARSRVKTRVKEELKSNAEKFYEPEQAAMVKKLNTKRLEILSFLKSWHSEFGGGIFPQVYQEVLDSGDLESVDSATFQRLIDTTEGFVDVLEMPDTGQSEFMKTLKAIAGNENLDLGDGDDNDKLAEFKIRMKERFVSKIGDMKDFSLDPNLFGYAKYVEIPAGEDPFAPIEGEDIADPTDNKPAGGTPSIGGAVSKPQTFNLTQSQVKDISKTLPDNQQKAFQGYAKLNPNIRIILDDASKMTMEQLASLSGGDIVELKTQLSALGLVPASNVYGKSLSDRDIEALRLIGSFNGMINPDRGILD